MSFNKALVEQLCREMNIKRNPTKTGMMIDGQPITGRIDVSSMLENAYHTSVTIPVAKANSYDEASIAIFMNPEFLCSDFMSVAA